MTESTLTRRKMTLIMGQSEMAERIRAHNWAMTSLGGIGDWSEGLLAAVNLMLHSPFPTILGWETEMVFLYNDAAIPTLAARHPEALGAVCRDVFPEAWDLVRSDLEACLYRGETAVRDNMFTPILVNGKMEEHFFSYSLVPVYENGRIGGICDVFRNTTETVIGARKLRESEARLKLATDVAKLGVFVWDSVAMLGSWENSRMYEIFGRTQEEGPINGPGFLSDVLRPESREAFQQALESTLQKGEPFHFEGGMRLPDGTSRCIEVNGNLQPPAAGTTGRILGTVRDVTEIRAAEAQIRESAKHLGELAAIVASSEDVIISKDLNGIVTSWNDTATRVFGYTADEMIGTSILRLIPEHLYSDEPRILANIREGRRIEHFETVRLAKDGRLIDVSLTVSPIKDKSGQVIGASKILRDVSARKRIEQSLLQAEKIAATGRMAATIAHEINNPLEAVMNLLYLLRPMVTDPDGVQYLSSAETELGRVAHIAKQTLGYYREHASASRASLAEIVLHAITIYEPRCGVTGIVIRKSIDSSAKIVLRRGEMMQVISNVIANAIHAMPAGGVLSISIANSHESAGDIVLTIGDTGVGIAPETLPKVFDAFFTTRSDVGTGIGLFVAKQLVEGHGGRISIESSNSGQAEGTIVRIVLPLRTTYDISPGKS